MDPLTTHYLVQKANTYNQGYSLWSILQLKSSLPQVTHTLESTYPWPTFIHLACQEFGNAHMMWGQIRPNQTPCPI